MALRVVQFIAVLLAGIALIPAGAHLFALPNKVGLAQEPYFIVQNIYRGWALFGIVWFGALIAAAVLAFMLRSQKVPCAFAAIAALCVAAMLLVFFIWTFPANQATDNWTAMPANWETLPALGILARGNRHRGAGGLLLGGSVGVDHVRRARPGRRSASLKRRRRLSIRPLRLSKTFREEPR